MSEKRPGKDFGTRRPAPPPPGTPPVKRSGHVALLVMGTIAVGATAYTLMPRSSCDPPPAGVAAPAQPVGCSSRSSSGGGHGSSRSSFYGSDSSGHSSSGGASQSGSGGVTRGGFGSFGHGFGFSGSG